jgi:hypothetical protein
MLRGRSNRSTLIGELELPVPDVDQALVRLILGRSAYRTAEEREAETLASPILCNTVTG